MKVDKSKWKYVKFGEVGNFFSGYTPKAEEISEKEAIPYFKVAEMNLPGNERWLYNTGLFVDKNHKVFPPESIVFPKNGAAVSTNKKRLLNTYSVVDLNTAGVSLNENCSPIFAYYWILTKDFKDFIRRGTIPTLNLNNLKQEPFPLPELDLQKEIVSELDALQEVIVDYREQIADLDALAQSIFLDTFDNPITNPKGWEIKKYGDLFNIVGGGTPSTKEKEYWENGSIPWIGSNMCNNSILYKTDGKFITEQGLNNSSAKLLNPGTTLIAMVGATIGKTAYLKIPLTTNQNVAAISLRADSCFNPIFVFYNSKFLYPLFQEFGGQKFTIASLKFIKNLPMIIPPLGMQQQFADQVEAIEKQKELLRQQLADAEMLMAERMQYYFS